MFMAAGKSKKHLLKRERKSKEHPKLFAFTLFLCGSLRARGLTSVTYARANAFTTTARACHCRRRSAYAGQCGLASKGHAAASCSSDIGSTSCQPYAPYRPPPPCSAASPAVDCTCRCVLRRGWAAQEAAEPFLRRPPAGGAWPITRPRTRRTFQERHWAPLIPALRAAATLRRGGSSRRDLSAGGRTSGRASKFPPRSRPGTGQDWTQKPIRAPPRLIVCQGSRLQP